MFEKKTKQKFCLDQSLKLHWLSRVELDEAVPEHETDGSIAEGDGEDGEEVLHYKDQGQGDAQHLAVLVHLHHMSTVQYGLSIKYLDRLSTQYTYVLSYTMDEM